MVLSTTRRTRPLRPEGSTTTRPSISDLVRRHPVISYYALAFTISWGGILLVLGPAGFSSTGATMPIAGGAALLAGPAVAGILLTGLAHGRHGLRRLLSRLGRCRVGLRWYSA